MSTGFALPSQRLDSIDQFRGFAILLMVLANYAGDVETLPAAFKHAPDIGLTVVDLIAPLFIFAIGLTFGSSARRRWRRDGPKAIIEHFLVRALALIGIGSIIGAGEILLGYNASGINWGVLQSIGAAILVAFPTLGLPTFPRLAVGLALLAGYQFLLERFWLATVLASPHGGLPGALSWGAMLVLASVLADWFHNAQGSAWRARFGWASLLTLALGIALSLFAPISKNRVSASYVLVSLGASALVFAAFHVLAERFKLRLPALSAWGRNPLLLYLLHYLLLGLFVLPGIPAWHAHAPLWLVALQAAGLAAALSVVGVWLDRRGWYWSL